MTDRNVTVQNGQGILPSIEITEFEESATAVGQTSQTVDRSNNTRNATMRRARSSSGFWNQKRLPPFFKLILLTFVPHIVFGSAMLILGYVSWEIRTDDRDEVKPSEIFSTTFKNGKLSLNPMILTDVFAISSIGIGLEFVFSGISGFLTARQKLKEYVQCHILWLSLSALSSVLLIASCSFGLRESRNISQGLAACVYAAIATSSAEVFCILYNFYVVTYHLQNRPGQIKQQTRNSTVGSAGRTQVTQPLGPDQNETTEQGITNDQTSQVRHSPTMNGRIPNRRPAASQGYHGRRRRSGQAGIRDRIHLLHPGINPSVGRNRLRRRPILRAQNHYVSIPLAYGRPRAASRSRNQNAHPAIRRNGGEVPMFVIANHNRYVQELNQSMENLESTANRGSVPGDAFPLINAVGATTTPKTVLHKSKSADVTSLNRNITPAFLRQKPSLQSNVCLGLTKQTLEGDKDATHQITPENNQPVLHHRKLRDNLGYSVVMKTKRSEFGPKRMLKNVRSVDDNVTRDRSLQGRRNFSVSTMEDAVFNESEHANNPSRNRFIYPACPSAQSQKPDSDIPKKLKCGHTVSEGNFKNLPYSDISSKRQRYCQTSVSSDSVVLKSESDTKFTSRQSPNSVHNEEALEMKEFPPHDFSLSPVSNNTPSYENLSDSTNEVLRKFEF